MPRLIWSLTLGNCITLPLPQFSCSILHHDSHRALRALQGLTMTSWSTIHQKKFCGYLFGFKLVIWLLTGISDGLSWKRLWLLQLRMWCWWLSQLRIWCESHRAWVRSQQALIPGISAAQSSCLFCVDEVEECDCLKGHCSPSMDFQVCVEWGWGQKYRGTISHSAGSCGFLHSYIQHTHLGQGRRNQDT